MKKAYKVFTTSTITEWCIRNINIAILKNAWKGNVIQTAAEFILCTHAVDYLKSKWVWEISVEYEELEYLSYIQSDCVLDKWIHVYSLQYREEESVIITYNNYFVINDEKCKFCLILQVYLFYSSKV